MNEDGGPPDGGLTDPDAGSPDGGMNGDGDCVDAPLGTLVLAPGFAVDSTAPYPSGLATGMASFDEAVFGIDAATSRVVELGTWPALAIGADVFDIIQPSDAGETTYLSGFLTADASNQTLAAGYTRDFDAASGTFPGVLTIKYFNGPAEHTACNGIWDAAAYQGLQATVVVANALSMGTDLSDNHVFARHISFISPVIQFPADDFGGSGYIAVSPGGDVAAGFADASFDNQLGLAAADVIDGSIITQTPTIDYSAMQSAGGGVFGVKWFAGGFAVLRAHYDDAFNVVFDAIDHYALQPDGLWVPTALLNEGNDACETIDYITTVNDDLVLRMQRNGETSLVRLAAE